MKTNIYVAVVYFLIGFVAGGILVNEIRTREKIETISSHINLIMPRTEAELKKQLLYNSCSQTMLLEMVKLEMVKVDTTRADKKFHTSSKPQEK